RRPGQQGHERNEDLDPHLFTHHNIASIAGRRPIITLSRPELRLTPREITSWIGQNHVAYGLVIFDVAGTAAQVSVERLGNGLLEFGPRHRIALQTLEQHLAFVQKTRSTVAALEGKMRDNR